MGRLLIWAGLSEHMGGFNQLKKGRGYRLDRSDRGKPVLLDEDGCQENNTQFNISHQVTAVIIIRV